MSVTMSQIFTRQQVSERNLKENASFVIDNVVYDVSTFLDDHPGGTEVLLHSAGGDASRCFHEVGHSEDAIAWRERFSIGEIVPEEHWEVIKPPSGVTNIGSELTLRGVMDVLAPPLLLAATAILGYIYLL